MGARLPPPPVDGHPAAALLGMVTILVAPHVFRLWWAGACRAWELLTPLHLALWTPSSAEVAWTLIAAWAAFRLLGAARHLWLGLRRAPEQPLPEEESR